MSDRSQKEDLDLEHKPHVSHSKWGVLSDSEVKLFTTGLYKLNKFSTISNIILNLI